MQKSTFKKVIQLVSILGFWAVLGLMILMSTIWDNGEDGKYFFIWILAIISLLGLLYSYSVNRRLVKNNFPEVNTKRHNKVVWFSYVTPVLAYAIGDYAGALNFSDDPYGLLSNFTVAVTALPILAATLTFFCIQYAAILDKKLVPVSLKIINRIGFGLLTIIVTAVSFFACYISYTLHEPSTE